MDDRVTARSTDGVPWFEVGAVLLLDGAEAVNDRLEPPPLPLRNDLASRRAALVAEYRHDNERAVAGTSDPRSNESADEILVDCGLVTVHLRVRLVGKASRTAASSSAWHCREGSVAAPSETRARAVRGVEREASEVSGKVGFPNLGRRRRQRPHSCALPLRPLRAPWSNTRDSSVRPRSGRRLVARHDPSA